MNTDLVAEMQSDAHQRNFALQQFWGWRAAQDTHDITRMVEWMGLTDVEWEAIRDDAPVSDRERNEIDAYFEEE